MGRKESNKSIQKSHIAAQLCIKEEKYNKKLNSDISYTGPPADININPIQFFTSNSQMSPQVYQIIENTYQYKAIV